MEIETDIAIIGAGPTGLYGAYCAGFRGLRTVLVDALPQVGGQISALYPEKEIRDVAGVPGVLGRSLVAALSAQAAAYEPVHLLGRQAVELRRDADPRPVVVLSDGTAVRAGAVVLTSGIGTFTPRPLPAGEEWLGRGLTYFVPDPSAHAGHHVVVVGGGDSAVDWSLALAPLAWSVTLVHRRAAFRAHPGGVAAARAAGVRIVVDSQVVGLSGAERVERAH
ncbi:NAD(P)/FAD-dependent oxidoreductase, partial [Nonomuraea sp. NPDC003201]